MRGRTYIRSRFEVNSLWPIEQCGCGKSANQIRNFGKGLALRAGSVGLRHSGRRDCTGLGERPLAGGREPDLCRSLPVDCRSYAGSARFGWRRTADLELVTGESDCLIKTALRCQSPGVDAM